MQERRGSPLEKIDWDPRHPEWQEIVRSLNAVTYESIAVERPAVTAVLDALRTTHANGGAVIARFRIVDARGAFRAHWSYTSPDYDFFQHFLGSEGVREALPELQIPARLGQDLGFEESPEGTLILDGQIAATLVHGGAYLRFEGTAQQAKELGRAFVDALIGDRHTGFKVWRSYEAWTPWFFDISWDYSWVLLDVERAEVTLLCVTDTD